MKCLHSVVMMLTHAWQVTLLASNIVGHMLCAAALALSVLLVHL